MMHISYARTLNHIECLILCNEQSHWALLKVRKYTLRCDDLRKFRPQSFTRNVKSEILLEINTSKCKEQNRHERKGDR